MITKTDSKNSKTKLKLYVDLFLFISFLLINIPHGTGIAIHEWASFLFIVPLIIHILLDWNWVVSVTMRIFGKLPGEVRFNHLWDLLIFMMMVLALLTGTLISREALPTLGIEMGRDGFWFAMHELTTNLLMFMIGVHLAMHWSWIVRVFKRYIFIRRKDTTKAQFSPQGGD